MNPTDKVEIRFKIYTARVGGLLYSIFQSVSACCPHEKLTRDAERKRDTDTHRQTDGRTDRLRQTGRQADYTSRGRLVNDRNRDRYAKADMVPYRQTDRQEDRKKKVHRVSMQITCQ